MARRPPAGPIGNSPRDLRDDFVGEAAENAPGGPPMRWPPSPKMKRPGKDTFHAKVSGASASARADRSSFRRGHYMKRGK